ncbi:NADP-dependent oxidoreductase domain-containing protein [Dendryphion nanum]|uniref:NADP-dependent oxidoreductase domain-containing protein n=1 Tax=Dendryphion nanum TaxID=256645 RepID=A0A9P9ITS8_9PLEO|nr:NADP-dependent oxidoreductase domain-containing protein [Dendryphion nanum]
MTLKVVFGAAPLGRWTQEQIDEIFSLLKKENISVIDTARLYEGSEKLIGTTAGHEDFVVDTKILGGFSPGSAAKDRIIADAQDSLDKVKIKQFDILYLHAPDESVPIEETLDGINEVYKKGIFKRFGLSNFSAEQVQEVYDIAKSKGYVVPSVYQGNYSAIARATESLLFPTLRKLGFAFYAYSPIAGGFLTKTIEQLDTGAGRFNAQALGGLYNALYNKPSLREGLSEWNAIAEKEGVSKAELAYRWVGFHSQLREELGDAVIFGASSLEQVGQTVEYLRKGKLSDSAAERIDKFWETVKHEAPLDNWKK